MRRTPLAPPPRDPPLKGKDYVDEAIAGFEHDPADTDFQRGFLACLKVLRDEAF